MESEGVWGPIFDEIKLKEGLNSDAALAETLGVSRAFVSAVRKNRKGVSNELGHKLYQRLGRPILEEDLELFMAPRVQKVAHPRFVMEIKQLVLMRANGFCELCESPAPFLTQDGKPYLEIHHLGPISTSGSRTLNNAVALCPNCHRKLELCPSAGDLMKVVARAKLELGSADIGLILESHKQSFNRSIGSADLDKEAKRIFKK